MRVLIRIFQSVVGTLTLLLIVCNSVAQDSDRQKSANKWISKLPHGVEIKNDEIEQWTIYTNKPTEFAIELLENDINYNQVNDNLFLITTSFKKISAINPTLVSFLSNESTTIQTEASVFDLDLSVNTITLAQNEFPIESAKPISIRDFQFDVNDFDLRNHSFVSDISIEEVTQHPSEMATIVAGSGINSITSNGVIPGNDVFSVGFNDLLTLPESYYSSNTIEIENHSYGTEIENFYGIRAMEYDRQLSENPFLLHIFSIGNRGLEITPDGRYRNFTGFGTITGNFKQSKNSILVGAIDLNGNSQPFSSKGPAFDGRVKPEIVAYSNLGTSNANALVSGSSARLKAFYEREFDDQLKSDLLRSILIASADDVGRQGIDFETGYGSLNLSEAHEIIDKEQFINGLVTDNGTNEFLINLPQDVESLRVSLSWIDEEATPQQTSALINDLDLEIISPTNEIILPWVLDDSPSLQALTSLPVQAEDHLNNNELITIENAPAGLYRVNVRGFDVTDNQAFAVSYRIDEKDSFEWLYPLEGQTFSYDGALESALRWKSGFSNTIGELQLLTDSGEFETLSEIDLSKGFLEFPFENFRPGLNTIRMKVGDSYFETESFVVSTQPIIRVGGVCDQELILTFLNADNNASFEVQYLDESTLSFLSLGIVYEPSISIDHVADRNYRVIPIYDGLPGANSELIKVSDIDFCYFNTLLADAQEDMISIEGFLASDHLIENIQLFKIIDGETVLITEQPFIDNELVFLDPNPENGLNTYFLRIERSNGISIDSELVEAFYISNNQVIISPNPAQANQGFTVLVNSALVGNSTITFFDAQGKILFSQEVDSINLFIEENQFPQGIIFLKIINDNGDIIDEKLILN